MKRILTLKGPAALTSVISICLVLFNPRAAFAGGVVSSATDAALRAAMVGGGTVTFSVDGVITLTNSLAVANNTTVDGSGHSITISGGNTVRLFNVSAGVSASFVNLTLANGRHVGADGVTGVADAQPGMGGAILNNGGTVALTGCTIASNTAAGGNGVLGASAQPGSTGGAAQGGAIFNAAGSVLVTNSIFISNVATGGIGGWGSTVMFGLPGGDAIGGAIYSSGGTVTLQSSVCDTNAARGGTTSQGFSGAGLAGAGYGGGLGSDTTTVIVYYSQFIKNVAIGASLPGGAIPNGGPTGAAEGGAIYVTNGVMTSVNSRFATNTVISGRAPRYGVVRQAKGGAISSYASASVSQGSFLGNQAIGNFSGGPGSGDPTVPGGGDAAGGAIFSGNSLVLTSSSFARNLAQAGRGGNPSGFGHPGGIGTGGAVCNAGTLAATNCTLIENSARGGSAPFGGGIFGALSGGGNAFGGGVFNTNGTASLMNLTFLSNNVTSGESGSYGPNPGPPTAGFGGAICNTNGTLNLGNCIVAYSTKVGTNFVVSTNTFGPLVDLGNNLNTELPGFSGSGSVNGADPVLGPLDNYGGPTLTLPLLAGSPAIDAGNTTIGPATDQRGRPRPFGSASDIGAYESSAPFVIRGRISGYTLQNEVPVLCETTNTTTSQGLYTLWVPVGTSTVTPADSNYVFFPANRLITTGPDRLNADFKAYRWNTLTIESFSAGSMRLTFAGTNGQTYRIVSATDLFSSWVPVSTNTPVSSNLFDVNLPVLKTEPSRFFRGSQP